jgi:hypothetical protein
MPGAVDSKMLAWLSWPVRLSPSRNATEPTAGDGIADDTGWPEPTTSEATPNPAPVASITAPA